MKANEFVKKFGWEVALTDLRNHEKYNTRSILYNYDELKRLVESRELINSLGGMEQAKAYAIDANACGSFDDENKLKQAILDVESCQ